MKEKVLKKVERNLEHEAMEKFGSITSDHAKAYIYGTKRNLGWKPKRERKKG